MRQITLNRQKLGLEDLLIGTGTVTQTRGGEEVEITKINLDIYGVEDKMYKSTYDTTNNNIVDNAEMLTLDTSNTTTPSIGQIRWNQEEQTADLGLNSNVTLQIGQESVILCRNQTGSIILNGKVVMAIGTTGNSGKILIGLHDGTKANAKRVIGIATEDIGNNSNGFVTSNGKVRGLDTTGSTYGETWLDGEILFVKANGALTKVEPLDSELKMPIAFVLHAHTNGTLVVRTTGIDENHTVTKSQVGLSNVDNTSDANKPVSSAQQTALNLKANLLNPKFTENVSIGNVNISSWASSLRVLEGNGGTFFGNNSISALTGSNAYYDGSWKYKVDGSAGLQLVNQGSHQFRVATTGVADGAISWITTANIDNTGLSVLSGTALLPGYGFLSDLDTGVYNPSANSLGFVTGGVERVTIDSNGNILNKSGAIGYGAGSGSTVSQTTSNTTAVTINKPTGSIAIFGALTAESSISFSINNSFASNTDFVLFRGSGLSFYYNISISGIISITVTNSSGENIASPNFRFCIIKGATS